MKIFDLQFFASGLPSIDWANMALYSLDFDLMESNIQKLYNIYYEAFRKSCLLMGLDAPFNLEEFIQEIQTKAFPMTFIFVIFFYDPVAIEPHMAKRVQWIWEMTLRFNKNFLD